MEGPMASCTPIKPRESRRQTYGRLYVVDRAFAIQIRGGAETYFVALHKRHTNERSRRGATDDRTGPDRRGNRLGLRGRVARTSLDDD